MPRKDIYHDHLRTALEKDGWRIVNDPMRIVAGGVGLFIDLTAEPILTIQKNHQQIAVEVKSFEIQSQITSFYEALGKYLTYRKALAINHLKIDLYLAVPKKAFDTIFQKDLVAQLVKEYEVHLIIYSIKYQSIISWIKQ
jgi:XisH protein